LGRRGDSYEGRSSRKVMASPADVPFSSEEDDRGRLMEFYAP
jgi:hypothetical protein